MYATTRLAVRWRSLVPGPADLVFALVLAFVLGSRACALFEDPGTPWHLRLGRDIIATGTVPRSETLTYTHTHAPWVDQSWGFDVILALLVDQGGWTAAAVASALLMAAVYAALAKELLGEGACPIAVLFVTLLVVSVGQIHFLVRPHLVTLAFVYLTLRLCRRQHEHGGYAVLWVPALTAILANLHGGFLALPVIVATAAVGHAVSGSLDAARRRNLGLFGLACMGSAVAALANPYGLGLYRHVFSLLVSSGVTKLILEYQPAPFGTPQACGLELMLLGLVALPSLVDRRVDRYSLLHVLVWLHLSLTSIRNAPLFALVAALPLARLVDALPLPFRTAWSRSESRSPWIPAMALGALALAAAGVRMGGLDPRSWPLDALPVLDRQPPSARLFHEQDWGGFVESECSPRRSAYLDDRFEIFGKDAVLEYAAALNGGPEWDALRDRDHIVLVWLKPERSLARRLDADPGWAAIHRDKLSVLYRRVPTDEIKVKITSSARP